MADALEVIGGVVPVAAALGPAGQSAVARAAVAGAIACGHVDYYCDGLDITATLIAHNDLQAKLIPIPFIGERWGDVIGWAMPVCHDNTVPPEGTTGSCEQPGHEAEVPVPGSAGPNNSTATNKCVTGRVVGMSIGYDGDISFDVNDGPTQEAPGPNVAELTNYHNFQPGPGGSDAPGGIDVEIPIFDEARFLPQIIAMRPGLTVTVCGQWVADMHQLWNELHPVNSLVIHADEKSPPSVVPMVSGTLGTNGWYTSDLTLTWNLDDSHPAVTSSTGCGSATITADTAGQSYTCSATSPDGTTTQSITLKRDGTPPTVTCNAPDQSVWYGSDVGVPCTSSDGLSGLVNADEASFSLATKVAAGTETDSGSTPGKLVCDNASNCGTAGPYCFKVDKKAPTLTCADSPVYTLGQPGATVTATLSDGGSGPATSLASGPADTSSVGAKTAPVSGSDRVGNSALVRCPYQVGYAFSGWLAPVNSPPTVNTGKGGRTYRVKWQLRNSSGNFISSLSAVSDIRYKATSCASFTGDPSDALEASATGGTSLRYDTTTNQYIYNWATPGSGCYTLFLTLDSGQIFAAHFNLS
jgi:hypothetical protein